MSIHLPLQEIRHRLKDVSDHSQLPLVEPTGAPTVNITYICPEVNSPTGGIRLIYRHVELISGLIGDKSNSYILHPNQPDFQCTWFKHMARFKRDLSFTREQDFVVVPEVWVHLFATQLASSNIRYAIFIQNGYLIMGGADKPVLEDCYRNAEIILTISEDATGCVKAAFPGIPEERIHRIHYGMDTSRFRPHPNKEQLITYMPRRLADHAIRLVFFLSGRLPAGWCIEPIDGKNEDGVAAILSRSRIFLSFSALEGLGLPPLEAALSGNLVVGYTGEGGKEYWDPRIFTEVHCGDILGFSRAVQKTVSRIDHIDEKAQLDAINMLATRYSPDTERLDIANFLSRIRFL